MSEAVLISIRPEWCRLIANGEKTVEIRKTRPRMKPPFRCYIYCSASRTTDPNRILEVHGCDGKIRKDNGHVMGEFVCDRIYELKAENCPGGSYYAKGQDQSTTNMIAQKSCLDLKDMHDYLHGKKGYAWNISDLRLYEIPKKIGKFERYDEYGAVRELERAPQSWQYVRDTKNEQQCESASKTETE